MAQRFSFNTFRLVCLRDDDASEDDTFLVDILLDGQSTRDLPKEMKTQAAEFLAGLFAAYREQGLDIISK